MMSVCRPQDHLLTGRQPKDENQRKKVGEEEGFSSCLSLRTGEGNLCGVPLAEVVKNGSEGTLRWQGI